MVNFAAPAASRAAIWLTLYALDDMPRPVSPMHVESTAARDWAANFFIIGPTQTFAHPANYES